MLIEAAAHRCASRRLEPYFDPIEEAFSRLQAKLQEAGERTAGGLWRLIGKFVDLFKPT